MNQPIVRSHNDTAKRPISRLVWAGVVGPVLFVVLDLLAAALRPGYDLTYNAVSELAVGPLGWLQTLNFILVGVLTMLLGAGLSARSRLLAGLFALWGISFVAIGLLPIDFDRFSFLNQKVHYIALDAIALLFPVMCLAVAFVFWKQHRGFSLLSLALFLFAIAVTGSWLIWTEAILNSPILGLYERFVIWLAVAWCLVLSWNVARQNR